MRTGQNSKRISTTQGQYTLVSWQQKAFLPPSRVNPYPGARVPCIGRGRYSYRGMCAMPPVPAPISSYSFGEDTFRKIEFSH